jgi:hypothetical protein
MRITVVADASGSMSSMAKIQVVAALLGFYRDMSVFRNTYDELTFVFYQLGNTQELDPKNIKDVLKAGGKTSLPAIEDIIKVIDQKDMHILFLSDGRFFPDDISEFKRIIKSYPGMKFVPIAIGADADEYLLKKISTYGKIFRPEDAELSVELFLSGQGACPAAIDSVSELFKKADSGGDLDA